MLSSVVFKSVSVKVVQLKQILRENGLQVSGRKAVLIERCTENGINIQTSVTDFVTKNKNNSYISNFVKLNGGKQDSVMKHFQKKRKRSDNDNLGKQKKIKLSHKKVKKEKVKIVKKMKDQIFEGVYAYFALKETTRIKIITAKFQVKLIIPEKNIKWVDDGEHNSYCIVIRIWVNYY